MPTTNKIDNSTPLSAQQISLRSLFAIRQEERWMMLAVMGLLVALNVLTIAKYYDLFTPLSNNYWNLFITKFHVSGFDPISYYVISDWEARYNVYRHPLLAFMMWIPYLLNRGLMALTGVNCALFLMSAMQIVAAWYAFLFMYRVLRHVVGLTLTDARLLTCFLYSFAFIMVSAMVPDHFIFSLCALMLTLYVAGRLMRQGLEMGIGTTIGLFFLTAGITLNNGLKVFMAALMVNKRRFFRPLFLAAAVVVPALLIWKGARYEYHYLVAPGENARHVAAAKRKAAKQQREAQWRLAHPADTTKAASPATKPKPKAKKGAPLMQGEFMRWTDITTPRWESIVENLMGESIQLHPDYLLQDESRTRPMLIAYRWAFNYVTEGLIALLFLAGIWMGRRSHLLWLAMAWFGMDMLLHIGIGFGINEVYIMTCHWAFVIPLAMAFLFKMPRWRRPLRCVVGALTLYLYVYNGYFIINYMLC